MTDQYSNYLTALANRDQQLTLIAAVALGYVALWFIIRAVPLPDQVRKIITATYLVTMGIAVVASLISALFLPWRTA